MPRVLLAVLLLLTWTVEARQRAVRHPGGPAPQLTVEEWIAANAIPFATTEARSGLSDLAPVRNLVGNARIVSLGEATHGSREFFTMKHRMLEYLVEEMGFTIFAIEANLPEADAVDDYVLHGIGDPRQALQGMYFWTWNTAEVLDMIEWMREYNLRRGDRPPVRFRGFDAQVFTYAATKVEQYVARVDPPRAAEMVRQYECLRANKYHELPPGTRFECSEKITEGLAMMTSRREQYIAASSVEEYEKHLRYARVTEQAEDVQADRENRDRMMAENVEWLADVAHPGEKLVLWAHNWHVAANGVGQMGLFLRERFGTDMVIFGFAFENGRFNARGIDGLTDYRSVATPQDGWEKTFFVKAGKPLFFLDVRNPSAQSVVELFRRRLTMWIIGAVWAPSMLSSQHRWPVRLPAAFDVIIYIESVRASKLLPFD